MFNFDQEPDDGDYCLPWSFTYAFESQQFEGVPIYSGVYLILSVDHLPLYVGQSKNIARRWCFHELSKPISILFPGSFMRCWRIPNFDLRASEHHLIESLSPRFNTLSIWEDRPRPELHSDFKMKWNTLARQHQRGER